ncbi:MAG: hypothetical protein RIT45_1139 [Pseudomonadota bacterium]|jgi:superfamily II DNA or RNA helicase
MTRAATVRRQGETATAGEGPGDARLAALRQAGWLRPASELPARSPTAPATRARPTTLAEVPAADDDDRRGDAAGGGAAEGNATRVWRLTRDPGGRVAVVPVLVGAGGGRGRRAFGWNEPWSRAALVRATGQPLTPLDHRVFALHEAACALAALADPAGAARLSALAVRAVAESPDAALRDDHGRPVTARVERVGVRLRGDDAGYAFEWLDARGAPWPDELAVEAAREGLRDGFATVLRGGGVAILDLPAAACEAVLRGEGLSAEQVLAQVRALRRAGLTTHIADGLPIGEAVRSGRLELRLAVGEDGLEAALRVAPFGDGATWPPGIGEGTVLGLSATGLRRCERDRPAEVADAEALRATLGLPPPDDAWRWQLGRIEDALALVERAEALAHAVDVRWDDAPCVVRPEPDEEPVIVALGQDWTGAMLEFAGETTELWPLLDQLRGGANHLRLGDGRYLRLREAIRLRLAAAAHCVQALQDARSDTAAATALQALAAQVEVRGADGHRAGRAVAARRAAFALDVAEPAGLRATMRPYQRQGYAFLVRAAACGPGAILADDMGLGKTLQALALLLQRAESGGALVVAPASVLAVWEREAARFAPALRVRTMRARDVARRSTRPHELWLTSWAQLARAPEVFAAHPFGTVVLDEAQLAKNPTTARFAAAAGLRAGFRLLLSGTPIENRTEEAWALTELAVPGLLGARGAFLRRYATPIEARGDAAAAAALGAQIAPHLLRRRKEEVARDLPPRTEVDVPVLLSAAERERYEFVRRTAEAALRSEASGGEANDPRRRARLFEVVLRLRQLACHPRLCDPDSPLPSAKMARARALLGELRAQGRRALVFSQFTAHLDLCAEALAADGATLLRLDGRTPVQARREAVEAFQAGRADVLLVSLGAGGTGLTLTAADAVVLLDPWWNPALEAQAADRAHRIGQQRPVTVFRLLAEATVETRIRALQRRKASIAEQVLGAARGASASLSEAELHSLLAAEEPEERAGRANASAGSGRDASPRPPA